MARQLLSGARMVAVAGVAGVVEAGTRPLRPARDEATQLAPRLAWPPRTLVMMALGFSLGIPVIAALGRDPAVTWTTAGALALQVVLCLVAALSYRRRPGALRQAVRMALLAVIGLLGGVPGYFFGPTSGFAAFVVLALLLTAVLSGHADTKRPALAGWVTYISLALGQALAAALLIAGVLPDVSLTSLHIAGQTAVDHVVGHAVIQALYLTAFLVGRMIQRRYRRLGVEIADLVRAAACREALLDEARADYRRALDATRERAPRPAPALPRAAAAVAVVSEGGDTIEDTTRSEAATGPPTVARLRPIVVPPRRPRPDSSPTDVWDQAYRAKIRGLHIGVFVIALAGGLLFPTLVVDDRAVLVATLGIGCALAGVLLHQRLTRRGDSRAADWAWALAAVGSVGPAYALGLHSAFCMMPVGCLFAAGGFRSGHRERRSDAPRLVLAGMLVAYTIVFLLIVTGVLPDWGNAALRRFGATLPHLVVQHVAMMGAFVAAYAAGLAIDRRYDELVTRAQAAVREAGRQEALLADARAELAALEAEDGIFNGHTVGAYALGRRLGRGGMGEVYSATGPGGARVALKLVRRDRLAQPVALFQFHKEAEAMARVRSPFVARVLAIGGPEGLPYLAMEYVDGWSVAEVLRERERLAPAEALAMLRDIGTGLDHVHRAGVVHCDVKPDNVILTAGGRWKLVDFGIAHMLDAGGLPGVIMGTPGYMPPEQAAGAKVDGRADLYALCLVAYRALTGRPAFPRRGDRRPLRLPPDPRAFVAVPEDVALALRIGVAAAREDRFADAAELVAAFEDAFAGRLSSRQRRRGRNLLRAAPWAQLG